MTFLTKKVQKILPVVTKNWFQEWPNADKSCWQGVPCSGGRRENTHWYSETWKNHNSWFLPSEKDLLFVDMDIDTKPEDIKFESRATPNGELVYTEDPSKRVSWGLWLFMIVILVVRMMIMIIISMKVSEFSQQDINDGRILFKHKVGELDRIGWKIGGWRSRLWDLLTATHSGFQLWQDSHLGEWRPGDQCLKLYKSNKAPHHSPAQSIPETNFQPQPVSDNSRDLARSW